MSRALSEDELEAAVRKLKYGRAVGPDGLRGELLKGLYTRELFWLEDKQMWVEKHVYDTTPGSVLGDLLELLNAAFSASAVPKDKQLSFGDQACEALADQALSDTAPPNLGRADQAPPWSN
jgi:hypothetical protein